jgi:chemotaxis protein methyltransferase CheR
MSETQKRLRTPARQCEGVGRKAFPERRLVKHPDSPNFCCEPGLPGISEKEFRNFQELIHTEAGIWLSPSKTALLTGRLAKRLRLHGLKSFQDYYRLVLESPEEYIQMLDAISTNETRFFREPKHFELLESHILPRWIRASASGDRGRDIRVLSAGCSTGQEPYSVAMTLLRHFPPGSGWNIEIIAADLSTRVLEVAQRGVWSADKASEIPFDYLKAFMLKGYGDQEGKIKAGREIRSLIRFQHANLHQSPYPFAGNFDLIFCRNVLIYFDLRSREMVLHRLARLLSPDGYFFVGHAESLHSMAGILSPVIPTVYRSAKVQAD